MQQVKKTSLERYGNDHYSKTKEWKEKVKLTNNKKYGGKAPSCDKKIQLKMRNTTKERYNVHYYTQTEECKNKIKETSIKKYGVEHPLKSQEIRKKSSQPFLKTVIFQKAGNKCIFII